MKSEIHLRTGAGEYAKAKGGHHCEIHNTTRNVARTALLQASAVSTVRLAVILIRYLGSRCVAAVPKLLYPTYLTNPRHGLKHAPHGRVFVALRSVTMRPRICNCMNAS